MTEGYKYIAGDPENPTPDYVAVAMGTHADGRDDNLNINPETCVFEICVFPDSNYDCFVKIPVMDMVNNLIDDYRCSGNDNSDAKIVLDKFASDLKKRMDEL